MDERRDLAAGEGSREIEGWELVSKGERERCRWALNSEKSGGKPAGVIGREIDVSDLARVRPARPPRPKMTEG